MGRLLVGGSRSFGGAVVELGALATYNLNIITSIPSPQLNIQYAVPHGAEKHSHLCKFVSHFSFPWLVVSY